MQVDFLLHTYKKESLYIAWIDLIHLVGENTNKGGNLLKVGHPGLL